jgi:hypothetical protein
MTNYIDFESALTKFSNVKIKESETVRVELVLQHLQYGDNQSFLSFLEDWYGVQVKDLFRDQPAWSKMVIPLGDCNAAVDIDFDVVDFPAILQSVAITRKWDKKQTMYCYTYTFEISKEISGGSFDASLATTYLRRTDSDTGTGGLKYFSTKISKKVETV